MHHIDGFENVLHIGHHEWHGIRNCISYCPGNKLLISAEEALDENKLIQVATWISENGIKRAVFHGYSDNSDRLLVYLKAKLGRALSCYFISHVTTAQFDNYFEMSMQSRVQSRLRTGALKNIASVKPNFSDAFGDFWPELILNFTPNIPRGSFDGHARGREVYAPLDPGWRKNLYTNIVAGMTAKNVDCVKTANFPNGLESLMDVSKLRLVGYLRGRDLFAEMAKSAVVLICTFAECQPMTQLEAFAVGTPAITGTLGMRDFDDDPLIQLCTTDKLDNPGLLARKIEAVMDVCETSPDLITKMIADHIGRRTALAAKRYLEFLDLQ
jgi:glycosyltransferase involved in cell wall biosynthesis